MLRVIFPELLTSGQLYYSDVMILFDLYIIILTKRSSEKYTTDMKFIYYTNRMYLFGCILVYGSLLFLSSAHVMKREISKGRNYFASNMTRQITLTLTCYFSRITYFWSIVLFRCNDFIRSLYYFWTIPKILIAQHYFIESWCAFMQNMFSPISLVDICLLIA
jgi:hypothetical protein